MENNEKRSSRGRKPNGEPNPIDVHVGDRIKIRRTLLGLTQEKLAALLGLTFQQVQKYERGTNRVGASRLWDIGKVLDVPVSFFFEDMSEDITNQSPRCFQIDPNTISEENIQDIEMSNDPMTFKENIELIKNIEKICAHYPKLAQSYRETINFAANPNLNDIGASNEQ